MRNEHIRLISYKYIIRNKLFLKLFFLSDYPEFSIIFTYRTIRDQTVCDSNFTAKFDYLLPKNQDRNFTYYVPKKHFQIISGLAAINQLPKQKEKTVDTKQQQQQQQQQQQHSYLRQNRRNFLTQCCGLQQENDYNHKYFNLFTSILFFGF